MKTAILTDSTAYISQEMRERYNIHMIPLSVVFGAETYREEEEMTAPEFYQRVASDALPTTSQPSPGLFVEKFEQLAKEYDAVICIHLSSGISGTYQGAITAGTMVDGLNVYAFDSEISCTPQGFYALEAAELAAQGVEPEQILARLEAMKQSMRAYFMVDDLAHLQRGGRLSSAQAFIGGLLQVKPVLHFENKVIVPFEKIRTKKKAINRIVELFAEDASKQLPMRAVLIYANNQGDVAPLKAELEAEYPHVEFYVSYFGPVIGTHLGEGAIGLGWYMK